MNDHRRTKNKTARWPSATVPIRCYAAVSTLSISWRVTAPDERRALKPSIEKPPQAVNTRLPYGGARRQRVKKAWRWRDSNPRHPACKAGALPLSYIPIKIKWQVGRTRLELVTSRLSGECSNQLSYRPVPVAGWNLNRQACRCQGSKSLRGVPWRRRCRPDRPIMGHILMKRQYS